MRGFRFPRLQGLGPVVLAVAVPPVLPPALAEPAHPPVAALFVLAGLPVLAQPSQPAPGAFRHQAQGAGAAPHRLRGSRGLGAHQLGDRPGVEPRPQPVLQQVGGHQGQPPTAYLPHHHRHADQSEDDGQRHAHLGRADGGVAVCAVGDGAHRRHRHDLREGESQQDLVLRLHVGRYFVLSHVFLSSLTSTYPLSGVGVAAPGASGSGSTSSMSIPGSTTAFITSSTTP